MEMLRKFLLVGLFITLEPGSVLQITIGTIVAAAYLMVQVCSARSERGQHTGARAWRPCGARALLTDHALARS